MIYGLAYIFASTRKHRSFFRYINPIDGSLRNLAYRHSIDLAYRHSIDLAYRHIKALRIVNLLAYTHFNALA